MMRKHPSKKRISKINKLKNKSKENSMSFKRIGGTTESLDNVAWKNPSAEIVKGFTCHISKKLHDIIRTANVALPKDEFSFLLKCHIDWHNHTVHVDDADVYFPRQKVSASFVNYLEDKPEYNGVLHKHPGKLKTFSSTDNTWINQNFQVSLLWVVDEFCTGIINIPSSAGRVQLPVVTTCEPDFIADEELLELIDSKLDKTVVQPLLNNSMVHGLSNSHPYMRMQSNEKMTKKIFENDEVSDEELLAMYRDPFGFSPGL